MWCLCWCHSLSCYCKSVLVHCLSSHTVHCTDFGSVTEVWISKRGVKWSYFKCWRILNTKTTPWRSLHCTKWKFMSFWFKHKHHVALKAEASIQELMLTSILFHLFLHFAVILTCREKSTWILQLTCTKPNIYIYHTASFSLIIALKEASIIDKWFIKLNFLGQVCRQTACECKLLFWLLSTNYYLSGVSYFIK